MGITYTNNTTDHNYRKGLDIHDGNNILIENNTLNGDRLYGVAVYNRQFTMDNVIIKNNVVTQDPSFRLDKNDNPIYTYHGYAGIHLQTNTQPEYKHFKSGETGYFEISDNTITGIDLYKNEHHTYGIEFRNHEPDMLYNLNITGNHIEGKETKYIIAAMNNGADYFNLDAKDKAGTGQGMGNINISGNTAVFETLRSPTGDETPINVQEDQTVENLRGTVNLTNNNFSITKASDSGTEMFQVVSNAKTINVAGNTLNIAGTMNKSTVGIINNSTGTEIAQVTVDNNTLTIDKDQNYGVNQLIGAHGKVDVVAGDNTINGDTINGRALKQSIKDGDYLATGTNHDNVVITGDVLGRLYTGSGSDTITIRGVLSGVVDMTHDYQFTHHSEGVYHPTLTQTTTNSEDASIINRLVLEQGAVGTASSPVIITGGEGRDIVISSGLISHANIDLSSGNDQLVINKGIQNSTVNLGGDFDSLQLSGLITGNTINLGNENNSISVQGELIGTTTQGDQTLSIYGDTTLDMSQFTGWTTLNLTGRSHEQYDTTSKSIITTTTDNTATLKLSDLIQNGSNRLTILGDAGDTVDLGANGSTNLGGFVKNDSLSNANANYNVYQADIYTLMISKDVTII